VSRGGCVPSQESSVSELQMQDVCRFVNVSNKSPTLVSLQPLLDDHMRQARDHGAQLA